jgi:hypothetical protein
MKYTEIGNENGGPNYEARYSLFYGAIKAKYPDMIVIANALVKSPMDLVDNHICSLPERMRNVANQYDDWDRANRPKVFVGEYAVNSSVGTGNLNGALVEAGHMIGFERNAEPRRTRGNTGHGGPHGIRNGPGGPDHVGDRDWLLRERAVVRRQDRRDRTARP